MVQKVVTELGIDGEWEQNEAKSEAITNDFTPIDLTPTTSHQRLHTKRLHTNDFTPPTSYKQTSHDDDTMMMMMMMMRAWDDDEMMMVR